MPTTRKGILPIEESRIRASGQNLDLKRQHLNLQLKSENHSEKCSAELKAGG